MAETPKSPSGNDSPRERTGPFVVYRNNNEADSSGACIIFGWVGSTPRLLRRAADLMLACNVRAVYTVTASTYDVFLSPKRLKQLGEAAMQLLQDEHAGEPVFLYYFSNGGGFVHEQLLPVLAAEAAAAQAQRRWPGVRIAGTIFDSTPTWTNLRTGSLAVSENFRSAAQRTAVFCSMWLFLLLVYCPFIGGFNRGALYWRNMIADPLPCPSLYVYSEDDKLTDPVKLGELVEARRKRHAGGVAAVRSLRITSPSAHVGHLVKHPGLYRDAVAQLMQDARQHHKAATAEARL